MGRGATRHQLLAVADWLAGGRLPVLIEPMVRIAPLVRCSPDGQRIAVVLLNMALEPSGPVTLRLRAHPQQVSLVSAESAKPLRSAARTERDRRWTAFHPGLADSRLARPVVLAGVLELGGIASCKRLAQNL
jgi:hypothetical protein